MAFPTSPSNDDLHTEFGRTFKYSSATNSWSSATPDAPEDNTPITQGYVDVQSLPLTGVAAGSKAFVQDGNKLFIFTGSGWFEIATINTAPTITSGANATYSTVVGGSPFTISLSATDPEGTPITWSHTITSGSIQDTTISNEGSVFTIVPGTVPSSFNVAFTASDGVNIDTSLSTFTLVVPVFQGTVAAYVAGGTTGSGAGSTSNTIDRVSFVSDGDAVDIGNLSYSSVSGNGFTDGFQYAYIAGGSSYSAPQTPTAHSRIRRFSFGSNAASVNIGTLATGVSASCGSSDVVGGYAFNYGSGPSPTPPTTGERTVIQKFAFGSNTSVQCGTTPDITYGADSWTTTTHGYAVGGEPSLNNRDYVYRYPFAEETTVSTMVKNLAGRYFYRHATMSSTTHGFAMGGQDPSTATRVMKFSFASNTDEVFLNVLGSTASTRRNWVGYSSDTHAYITGGYGGTSYPKSVNKYAYAAGNTPIVGVGDLTVERYNIPGHTQE